MPGAIVAVMATGMLCVSVSIFKAATARMPPLFGSRPFHLLINITKSPIWWGGLIVAALGLALEFVALTLLPLSAAAPPFAAGFIVLLVIAIVVYNERLTGREWAGLGLFAVAGAMVALSVMTGENATSTLPSMDRVLTIVIPSVLIPALVFSLGDLRPAGRHSRPVAGVAYGMSIGILTGVGEMAVKGLTMLYESGVRDVMTFATEPYIYIILAGPGLAIFQMQIALQRCRMIIVFSVGTLMAQVYMLAMAPLLYGETWPSDLVWVVVRVAGVVLAISAFVLYPRYDEPEVQVGRADTARKRKREPVPQRVEERPRDPDYYSDFDFSW
jgi:hypothetical protein